MATQTINLSSLDGTNGFSLDEATGLVYSSRQVSSAGDVNGDGFDDVIIGGTGASASGYGSSYVVFGKTGDFTAALNLSSLDGSNGFSLDGVEAFNFSSPSVSSAGDVNGDGFDDVIVGALFSAPNGVLSGSSYVVFGKAAGFSATMDLSSLDGDNGFSLGGAESYDMSGGAVSNAGDVNGDGFDDVIIGADRADPNGESSGSSYVVFGQAAGFDPTLNLSNLDGSNGFSLSGAESYDLSGGSVSNAGDVNGDGFDDVLIGAQGADPNGESSGSSYVVFGKASGISATLALSSLDGTNGFRLDGAAAGDSLGASVSTAGDVNGDGFDDVIVGAHLADSNGDSSGSSYVVFGKAVGFAATLNLSSLDGSNGFRLDGAVAGDLSGLSVSSAGDVNGDGFDDLIVGAPHIYQLYSYNAAGPSSSYVVFGKASGFTAALDLSKLDSSNGFRMNEAEELDYSGLSVSSAGDVNGDGFDDVIIGTLDGDPNVNSSSSSYVVFGRSSFTGDNVIQGTPKNDKLTGTAAAEHFIAGGGNDRMIGRGGADVFEGEAGSDYIRISDLSFELADGGSGNDILGLGGSGLNLDLTSQGDKISGIETIYLFGAGDNTLTLTAADVLNLSSTSNTLKVNGNDGDQIVGLSYGWKDGGIHGSFHTFTNEGAVLLVGVNVTTDFV